MKEHKQEQEQNAKIFAGGTNQTTLNSSPSVRLSVSPAGRRFDRPYVHPSVRPSAYPSVRDHFDFLNLFTY